jgi:hypothetical protein
MKFASGKTEAISDLKPGDKVVAVDTSTGKTEDEGVQAVLVNYDTDLYDLTVQAGGHTGVMQTTAGHLFWDPSLKQWVQASKLRKGEHLKTDSGQDVTVDGGDPRQPRRLSGGPGRGTAPLAACAANGVFGATANRLASNSSEVLLKGVVPPNAITWVLGGPC